MVFFVSFSENFSAKVLEFSMSFSSKIIEFSMSISAKAFDFSTSSSRKDLEFSTRSHALSCYVLEENNTYLVQPKSRKNEIPIFNKQIEI